MARTISVQNSKGGVGKTTTTDSIASIAGELGVPTLIVDLDPQGNASEHHLRVKNVFDFDPNLKTTFDVICHPTKTDITQALAKSHIDNVWIMPASQELITAGNYLTNKIGFEKILDKQLQRIADNFGLIIIDTGPTISVLTTLALRATHDVLYIPSDTSQDSINGVNKILEVVQDLEDAGHHIGDVKVILAAEHKPGAKSNIKSKAKLREEFGDRFFEEPLPHTVKVNDAQWADEGFSSPMAYLPKDHKLYIAYKKLTQIALGQNV